LNINKQLIEKKEKRMIIQQCNIEPTSSRLSNYDCLK